MTSEQMFTFAVGWAAGVVTPLLVEFLRRKLFDRPKLCVRTDLVVPDEDLAHPPFLHVEAVNMADVPLVLSGAFYTVYYCEQAVGGMEQGLPQISQEHDYPMRLNRHESYEQTVDLVPWIKTFLDSRTTIYNDHSPLDFARLEFNASFLDTTGQHWEGKRVKPTALDVRGIRSAFAPAAIPPVKPTDGADAP